MNSSSTRNKSNTTTYQGYNNFYKNSLEEEKKIEEIPSNAITSNHRTSIPYKKTKILDLR